MGEKYYCLLVGRHEHLIYFVHLFRLEGHGTLTFDVEEGMCDNHELLTPLHKLSNC